MITRSCCRSSAMVSVSFPSITVAVLIAVWADHGDTVSCAYAGTGALKSDFTRTGKRSKQGLLQDGVNSVMRYIKNNFFDGDRQDAFDILTGAWVAKKGGIPPLTDTRPLLVRSVRVCRRRRLRRRLRRMFNQEAQRKLTTDALHPWLCFDYDCRCFDSPTDIW